MIASTISKIGRKGAALFCDAVRQAYQKQFYPLGYVPALDGMRGLMTVIIVVAHVYYAYLPGVILYIDVFLAGSAYYITSLLLRDLDRQGRIDYREFYRRRFARILPPLIAMLGGYLLFRLFFAPPAISALAHCAIVLTYISNYWFIFDPAGIADLAHTWTLSVEEQFYIVWPVTFALLARRLGITWRLVIAICTIAAFVWTWRAWLAFHDVPWTRIYVSPDTRADDLMAGSALAVILKMVPPGKYPVLDRLLPRLAWPLLLYWMFVTLVFWYPNYSNSKFYYFGSFLCGAIPATITITMLIRSSKTVCHRIFENSGAVFLGHIFYGIYLWHFPILYYLMRFGLANKYVLLVGLPLSILLATLSYAYIDRHFMRLRLQRNRTVPNGSEQELAAYLIAARSPAEPALAKDAS
jgi:peptidoglycan/LPS O-acetylase OafA/YrhL